MRNCPELLRDAFAEKSVTPGLLQNHIITTKSSEVREDYCNPRIFQDIFS